MGKIPINIATGSLQQEEVIVGIDLGTTNSLIAFVHPETRNAVALKEHDGSTLVPSIVYFDDAGRAVAGEEAKQHLLSDPDRTFFSIKRLIGKTPADVKSNDALSSYAGAYADESGPIKLTVDGRQYTPADISAVILAELKKRAEHILKTAVNKAVITVPAYFNDAQRQATRDAGKLAGLEVLRIINEPTAASLAYGIGLRKDEQKLIAVYDFGGGTFDVSLLRLNSGIFEVLSTNGDTFLGGDDMDLTVGRYFQQQLGISSEPDEANAAFTQELRLAAEHAKKQLTISETFEGELSGRRITLNRREFNGLVAPLVERTIQCCRLALKDADVHKNDVDEVIMVGGSTRVPFVKQAVSEFFGKHVNDSVNPDEVVALGAAIQADVLAGNNKDLLLLDITPLSLGIETAGELMDVIIPRNAKIPSAAAREYTTQADGQVNMRISVYQGERDIVSDNRLLDTFSLKGIPAMPAGMAKVQVSFVINADGILTVKAKELRSGVAQEVEIRPQLGIEDADVEKMLLDSMANAQSDIAARALAEARTEGEQLLKTTERFLQKNADALIGKELHDTAAAMQALQLALTMPDRGLMQQKIEELNNISRPYAERIMDNAVSNAMKGRQV